MRPTVTCIAALLVAGAAPLPAQWPPQVKNLQVLPKEMKFSALVDTMKAFTRALGVRCTYCHVGNESDPLDKYDFASDDRPAKAKARVMLRMVNAINGEHLAALPTRRDPPIAVNCITCHHGLAQPRSIQQVIQSAYDAGGFTAADSTYRALRTRYYGSAR